MDKSTSKLGITCAEYLHGTVCSVSLFVNADRLRKGNWCRVPQSLQESVARSLKVKPSDAYKLT